jgi:hypothetical protein
VTLYRAIERCRFVRQMSCLPANPAGQAVLLTARRLYPAENPVAPNLPLAARPRVGHIGLAGDVAEWLKAAVC